ncbi:unnamed protein product [Lymnaea stagnalis]|uniref:Ig-like domain-containing protein n=1 Tax=Lymnaea stagnalis TaxID=6523 RepID=A0AAV2IKA7_LYMST
MTMGVLYLDKPVYLLLAIAFKIPHVRLGVVLPSVSPHCPPAEEGKPYTLVLNLTLPAGNTSKKISLETVEAAIAICNLTGHCKDFFPNDMSTTVAVNESTRDLHLVVSISNASRLTKGVVGRWDVIYIYPIFSCMFLIFTNFRNIPCSKHMVADELHVNCSTHKIYPRAKCLFTLDLIHAQSGVTSTNVTFENIRMSGDPTYYVFTCRIVVRFPDVPRGVHTASVAVYPSLTGDDKFIEFGANVSLTVNLEIPVLTMRNCPAIIEEGQLITCVCDRADHSLVSVSIAWLDDGTPTVLGRAGSLAFTANRQTKAFICNGTTFLGWDISPVQYKPEIIARAQQLTCTDEKSADNLLITCSTERIYPTPKCHFEIKRNGTPVSTENSTMSYHYEEFGTPVYYKTSCTLKVPRTSLSHQAYDVLVAMYPDLSRTETDMEFGTNKTFIVRIDDVNKVWSQWLGPDMIAFMVSAIVIVIVVAVVACVCRRKAFSNPVECCAVCHDSKGSLNSYDEINDGYILVDYGRSQGNDKYGGYRILTATGMPRDDEVSLAVVEHHHYETIDGEINARCDTHTTSPVDEFNKQVETFEDEASVDDVEVDTVDNEGSLKIVEVHMDDNDGSVKSVEVDSVNNEGSLKNVKDDTVDN